MSFWGTDKSIEDKLKDGDECANYMPLNKKETNGIDYAFFNKIRGCSVCDKRGNRKGYKLKGYDSKCPLYFPKKKLKK